MTSEDRFWAKVDKSGDCWLWIAGKSRKGYGNFRVGGDCVAAHRYIYEVHYGDLPQEMSVKHACGNRACVRPEHLRAVTGSGLSAIDRLMSKVEKDPSGCWLWTGRRHRTGYGEVGFEGKKQFAHRVSYLLHRGEIPPGLIVRHTCDTPPCVNPDHLLLGTNKDNTNDMICRGRARMNGATNPAKGEAVAGSKLSAAQVLEIRAAVEAGVTQESIAERYGICVANVSCIVLRKTWKHV